AGFRMLSERPNVEGISMTPTQAITRRMHALRKKRGWTAQRLADAMTGVGVPWDRQVVSKLENGRRQTVSAGELLALAYVLGIHPLDLLVPSDATDDEPYQVTPEVTAAAANVRAWIGGLGFLSS